MKKKCVPDAFIPICEHQSGTTTIMRCLDAAINIHALIKYGDKWLFSSPRSCKDIAPRTNRFQDSSRCIDFQHT